MISMMFLLSMFTGGQVQERQIENVKHDTLSVAALADGMAFYQARAIQQCWQNGVSTCPAGPIRLQDRLGSQSGISYGSGYETSTDGSTYVVTTLAANGAISGTTARSTSINAGVFASLKKMTHGSSTVGYFDKSAGGVVLPDRQNEIVSVDFPSAPIQGQPVLYTSIVTAPPPVQLASIDGGGYSPLVPLPPSVTPVPTSPEAIISPPASVSPTVPTSPTYTPPATVVVNPISPWAPSPVPPPPPPPVPPPPPPVPPPSPAGPPVVVYPTNMPKIHAAFPPSIITGAWPLETEYPLAKMQDLTLAYPCLRMMMADAGYRVTVVSYYEDIVYDRNGGVSVDTIRRYCDLKTTASYTPWITLYSVFVNFPDLLAVGQPYLDAYNAYHGTNYAFTNYAQTLGEQTVANYKATFGHYP